jgi:hypothetical protein
VGFEKALQQFGDWVLLWDGNYDPLPPSLEWSRPASPVFYFEIVADGSDLRHSLSKGNLLRCAP